MQQKTHFLFGAFAGVIFFSAVYALATMVDGYSHVAQTVSEIGARGSPAEMYLQFTNLIVALCLLVFARGLYPLNTKASFNEAYSSHSMDGVFIWVSSCF